MTSVNVSFSKQRGGNKLSIISFKTPYIVIYTRFSPASINPPHFPSFFFPLNTCGPAPGTSDLFPPALKTRARFDDPQTLLTGSLELEDPLGKIGSIGDGRSGKAEGSGGGEEVNLIADKLEES